MDRRVERGLATRRGVLEVATTLFTERGYAAVSTEAVLQACEISKGALYHHFSSKEALFTAVLEAVEERVTAVLAEAAAGETSPVMALRAGCGAWLRLAATDLAVRRIVLTDAPAVIGWAAWREMDARYGLGLLKVALQAVGAGLLEPSDLDLQAHVLLAIMVELAMLVARSDEPEELLTRASRIIDRAIEALAAPGEA